MERKYSSLHTHTVFCDGKADVETLCRAAYEKGLVSIGFSSHAPVGKTGLKTFWHMKDEKLGEYINEVKAARLRWEGKLVVYLGLEVDYIKGLRSPSDNDIKDLNLDYTIGAVHYLMPPHGEPFTIDGHLEELENGILNGFGSDGESMLSAYLHNVMEMVTQGGFDIVAHLDLVRKNHKLERSPAFKEKQGRWFEVENADYMQKMEEIARAISSTGLVIEANTGGINRGYIKDTYPSLAILRLMHRYKVPVMISADAHNPNDIDGHYREARQILLDAGYTSHVLFEGRKNGKPIWTERPL
ncbi:MAG: histidinol-phosphatase [Treponema sp.]|jgi:histidinol-phosphatase (PHP family)|nr:histidinol-phosphatase [Treponema sp.]